MSHHISIEALIAALFFDYVLIGPVQSNQFNQDIGSQNSMQVRSTVWFLDQVERIVIPYFGQWYTLVAHASKLIYNHSPTRTHSLSPTHSRSQKSRKTKQESLAPIPHPPSQLSVSRLFSISRIWLASIYYSLCGLSTTPVADRDLPGLVLRIAAEVQTCLRSCASPKVKRYISFFFFFPPPISVFIHSTPCEPS